MAAGIFIPWPALSLWQIKHWLQPSAGCTVGQNSRQELLPSDSHNCLLPHPSSSEMATGSRRLHHPLHPISSVQFSSVTQSCPTLCNPMDCSTPGLPVHHQLPEFTQTHVTPHKEALLLLLFFRLFVIAIPWTVACQAPLSMEFSRQ